jgi:hypothetical protein
MRTLIAVALTMWVTTVATASQATAGMCDQPPYGADPKSYKLYIDKFSEKTTVDFFPNICRAKYIGDERMRKSLVDVGVSSYEIDHDDVALIAVKVIEAYVKYKGIH